MKLNNDIYFLSFYFDKGFSSCQRNYSPAACNKVLYICRVLVRNGYSVHIVSPSWSTQREKKDLGGTFIVEDGIDCILFPSGKYGRVRSVINRFSIFQSCFRFLKKRLNEGDTLFVYHMPLLFGIVSKLKKKTRANVLVDVEEIYTNVYKSVKERKKEFKIFGLADSYIFPTHLLDLQINIWKKPSFIVHGTYTAEKSYTEKFDDGKIHCVYAGTFDPKKGGVYSALGAALYLSEEYHLHIIGFGSDDSKKLMLNSLKSIQEKTKCSVTYEGLKTGEDYLKFLQKCDVGLSTQNPSGAYNDTSFPSKILSYLSNGLRVVSIRIPVVAQSAIGEVVYYYDEPSPIEIARAIKSIDFQSPYDSRAILRRLDEDFSNMLKDYLDNGR